MLHYKIIHEFPLELVSETGGTKVSIYQKTHLSNPDNLQDPIRFKNTIKEVEERLAGDPLKETIIQSLESLLEDRSFWNTTGVGMALFIDERDFMIYKLSADVENVHHVGNHFYFLPLLNYVDALDHAYVLDINKDRFSLFDGSMQELQPVELPEEAGEDFYALYERERESAVNFGSYKGVGNAAFHGNKSKSEEEDKDVERYFRHIDHFLKGFLKPHQSIVLSAVPAVRDKFMQVTKLPVLDDFIPKSKGTIDEREYMELFRAVLQKEDTLRKDALKATLEESSNRNNLITDTREIERLIEEGRVQTLYISSSMSAYAKTNPERIRQTNRLTLGVIGKGGHFYTVDHDLLSEERPFAATLRF
ncbi:MAG: hypothetical protein Q4Q17_00310 [Tissierellia bacterium]|nr:hypothetical protein [Tissierellia bacterium]